MIKNPDDVHPYIRAEIAGAIERALAAGAAPPLEYVGAGMFGIVLCDAQDVAWKVARTGGRPVGKDKKHDDFMREMLDNEYEWLRDAAKTPAALNVAPVYALHPEQIVLERECVRGMPGGWNIGRELRDLHKRIEEAVEPLGWSAPEFKEDSYIVREDGIPVLVDISMPHRLGMNLADWVDDVLDGRRRTHLDWHTLGFLIVREVPYKTIPDDYARELLRRLAVLEPQLKESFTLMREWGLSGMVA